MKYLLIVALLFSVMFADMSVGYRENTKDGDIINTLVVRDSAFIQLEVSTSPDYHRVGVGKLLTDSIGVGVSTYSFKSYSVIEPNILLRVPYLNLLYSPYTNSVSVLVRF